MKKILYHGSAEIVKHPQYGKGKIRNDYGQGFYCTEDIELALEWAVDKNRNGFANEYEIEIDDLNILNLEDGKHNILHWLTILLQNRIFNIKGPLANEAKEYLIEHFSIPYREYDAIIGYRADDSYFAFAQDFLNGSISYQQLTRAMKFGQLGDQFVLISEKAFSKISFLKCHFGDANIYFEKKNDRDRKAREDYYDLKKNKRNKGDLFINYIIDEEIKNGDPRL